MAKFLYILSKLGFEERDYFSRWQKNQGNERVKLLHTHLLNHTLYQYKINKTLGNESVGECHLLPAILYTATHTIVSSLFILTVK